MTIHKTITCYLIDYAKRVKEIPCLSFQKWISHSAVGSFENRGGGGTTNRMSISASVFFSISANSGLAMTPPGPLLATTLSQLVNLSKL